ncbi:putative peroxisomal adenine nucleotide transporter 1 [Mollisia scopiformis]|uniref:Putative peroxisomal adenine nucleotide transporter 1 n=1 Tax=Mollisia scopiformis TaxID=149040 RepID=A0A194XGY1_MOLSC|nr:putative peroxisomal adenine nucleotide transporter 1 [Mollisia scopiformis]KUJ19389.1 putative peroxisomal adenine nucleotide transporter 1 [Mollisia scopiformis]
MANIYNSQLDAYSLYHKNQEASSPSALNGPALPALGHALAGSTGTAISNLAIYPLDLVITRLQVQRSLRKSSASQDEYKGVIDAFDKVYHNEGGIKAFYSGVVQDTGKSIADSFLFFLFYNYIRTNRLQKKGLSATTLPVFEELAVGTIAGACSKFFTTPIANIVTRKQIATMVAARSSTSLAEPSAREIAADIRNEKGLQGFWSGYSASLILTLNPSITFFLYETFKRAFLPRSERDNPSTHVTFIMAAMSKAIASTITYPFSLAKARAQTSSKRPVDSESAEIIMKEAENVENRSDVKKVGQDAKKFAQSNTVFDTILKIYRTEGAAGLYEGVFGEILKGFFSHGITMIIKETVHKMIIQAYYLVLKALNRYPSPSELAKQAGQSVQDAGEKAGDLVKGGYNNVTEAVSNMVGGTKETAGVAAERVGVIGNNTTEAAKTANDYASKEAGHLLGNAQEMLGGKIERVGQGIKPED